MLNFGLLITLISTLTGTYLLGIISLLFFQNRTILLRDYGLFILSLYLFSLAALFEQLLIIGSNEVRWLFTGLIWLIQITAGIMYIGTSPFFFFRMFNIVIKPIVRIILITVDIIAVVTEDDPKKRIAHISSMAFVVISSAMFKLNPEYQGV